LLLPQVSEVFLTLDFFTTYLDYYIKMSNVIIPAAVTMSLPGDSIIPPELWLKIFGLLLALSPTSNIGNIVDVNRFKTLWAMGPLFRIRKVSRTFSRLAMIVFYEANIFKFTAVDHGYCENIFGNYLAPLLPPLRVRPSLRRIQLTLFLSDTWHTLNVGNDNSLTLAHMYIPNQVASLKELFAVCPGARMLHALSNSMPGLKVLDLHLIVLFWGFDKEAAIAVYRSAGFSVVAQTINLKMTNSIGRSEIWHTSLARAIGL
jgi:hypothetical protein